eukprot:PhM_4_TR14848/c0_g1_i2/m.82918
MSRRDYARSLTTEQGGSAQRASRSLQYSASRRPPPPSDFVEGDLSDDEVEVPTTRQRDTPSRYTPQQQPRSNSRGGRRRGYDEDVDGPDLLQGTYRPPRRDVVPENRPRRQTSPPTRRQSRHYDDYDDRYFSGRQTRHRQRGQYPRSPHFHDENQAEYADDDDYLSADDGFDDEVEYHEAPIRGGRPRGGARGQGLGQPRRRDPPRVAESNPTEEVSTAPASVATNLVPQKQQEDHDSSVDLNSPPSRAVRRNTIDSSTGRADTNEPSPARNTAVPSQKPVRADKGRPRTRLSEARSPRHRQPEAALDEPGDRDRDPDPTDANSEHNAPSVASESIAEDREINSTFIFKRPPPIKVRPDTPTTPPEQKRQAKRASKRDNNDNNNNNNDAVVDIAPRSPTAMKALTLEQLGSVPSNTFDQTNWSQGENSNCASPRVVLSPRMLVSPRARNMTIEHVEEMVRKEDFLIRVGQLYCQYGCPAYSVESNLRRLSKAISTPSNFTVFPTVMLISFGEHGANETTFVPIDTSYNLKKLELLDNLVRRCQKGEFKDSILPAVTELDNIMLRKNPWPWWVQMLCFFISSACGAVTFFEGSMWDFFVGGLLGLFVGVCDTYLGELSKKLTKLGSLFSTMICAALARILEIETNGEICFVPTAFSAILWLLPGLSITMAVLELAQKLYVTGSSRLVRAFFDVFLQALGLAIGNHIVMANYSDYTAPTCAAKVDPLWNILVFPPIPMCFSVLLGSSLSQLPAQMTTAAMGYAITVVCSKALPIEITTTLSAFVIALSGNVFSKYRDRPSIIPLINGIILLVPGGLGVKGGLNMISGTGGGLSIQVITIALSISIGVFAANIVVFPRDKKNLSPLAL